MNPASSAALDLSLWAFLDPLGHDIGRAGEPDAAGKAASRLAEPGAARRFAELSLQHVLLREVVQEEHLARGQSAGSQDAELVREAGRQVPGAFDVLVERYFNLAVAAAYAVLSDAEAARDVAQDSFLEAARNLGMLRQRDKFSNWVYGIARRKAIYVLRRRQLHRAAVQYRQDVNRSHPPPEEPGAPLDRGERAREVRRALDKLPEIYREVLVLRYLDDRSYEEIAAFLGLSHAAVEKRLTRAKALLRDVLRRWVQE